MTLGIGNDHKGISIIIVYINFNYSFQKPLFGPTQWGNLGKRTVTVNTASNYSLFQLMVT